jgi:hypothetical protein
LERGSLSHRGATAQRRLADGGSAAHYGIAMRCLVFLALAALSGGCSLLRAPPYPDFDRSAIATPGESFVVLSGGACADSCPEYEIFVFESGRVVFNGKRHTSRAGLVERQTMPSVYFELRKLLSVRSALSRNLHPACRGGRPGFHVAAIKGDRVRAGYLNYGCFNQVDDLDAIVAAFVRTADAAALIGP